MSELSVLAHALVARFEAHVPGGRMGADVAQAIAGALQDVGIAPGAAPAADGSLPSGPIGSVEKILDAAKAELEGKLAEVFKEFAAHQVAVVDSLRAEIAALKDWVHAPQPVIKADPVAPAPAEPQPETAAPAAG